MMTKTVKLTVTVTPKVVERLTEYAFSRRASRGAIVRQAITDFMLRRGLLENEQEAEVLCWSKEFIRQQDTSVREAYAKKRQEVMRKARAAKKP